MIAADRRKPLPANAPTIGYICGGAGIGTIGFEIAGFRPAWNIDYDPENHKLSNAIAQIYEPNFGEFPIQQTIQEVASANFRRLVTPTGLVISQPCREFSNANPKGKEGELDLSIASAAAEAIGHFYPEFVVIENVPAYRKSLSWLLIENTLEALNYSIASGIVDTADFGVPQSRKRFIAIAFRSFSNALEFPIGETKLVGWHEALADRIPLLEDAEPTVAQQKRISKLSFEQLSQPLLVERVAWWDEPKVITPDRPCPTIRKSLFIDHEGHSRSHAFTIRLPNGQWKKVGMREIARLFSIPDWFWLPEHQAFAAGAAMGNGIPPLLTQAIGKAILAKIAQPQLVA